jgi:hypothetical protein
VAHKVGNKTRYKHIDDTVHDALAKVAAEREEVAWLKERLAKNQLGK